MHSFVTQCAFLWLHISLCIKNLHNTGSVKKKQKKNYAANLVTNRRTRM